MGLHNWPCCAPTPAGGGAGLVARRHRRNGVWSIPGKAQNERHLPGAPVPFVRGCRGDCSGAARVRATRVRWRKSSTAPSMSNIAGESGCRPAQLRQFSIAGRPQDRAGSKSSTAVSATPSRDAGVSATAIRAWPSGLQTGHRPIVPTRCRQPPATPVSKQGARRLWRYAADRCASPQPAMSPRPSARQRQQPGAACLAECDTGGP